MKIRVLFFGLAHDVTGFEEEHIDVKDGEVLGDLRRRYEVRFPRLAEMSESLLAAVNQELRHGAWPLADGDEVAFLPPVSGGSDDGNVEGDFFLLTRAPIPTRELAERLKAPEDGAVVVFEGIVRNHLGGRRTLYLEYEGYEPMAVRKMEEIGGEARSKFQIDRVGIMHRLGRIEISETSVAIIVSAAHRRAAFAACQHLIDRLKQVVPIWKKEYFEDGAVWVEGEGNRRVLVESSGG